MAGPVTVDLIAWDITPGPETPRACAEAVVSTVQASWDSGADLVLLPEFTWLMLEPLLPGEAKHALQRAAERFWRQEIPFLQQKLSRPDKAAVLGTCPFLEESSGRLLNRAPILRGGDLLHQDKLHLTPWESAFAPGDSLNLFTFCGLTVAVVICLDIEVPELSVLLRGRGVDLILCPSATETVLGVERVDRCASARAIELGCHVGVSHLLGQGPSSLVDENTGRVAVYHPSQVPFARAPRWQESSVASQGIHRLRTVIDPAALKRMRRREGETNPALLKIPNESNYRCVTLS